MTVRVRAVRFPVYQLYTIFMSPPVNPPVSKPQWSRRKWQWLCALPWCPVLTPRAEWSGGGEFLRTQSRVVQSLIVCVYCLISWLTFSTLPLVFGYALFSHTFLFFISFWRVLLAGSFGGFFLRVFLADFFDFNFCHTRTWNELLLRCFFLRVSLAWMFPPPCPNRLHCWGADFTAALPVCALRGRIKSLTGSWTRRN